MRLADLAPLKLVVPSKANTRRRLIETYLASNGVAVERLLELDAMLGTLDFVARTDWVSILPALMMATRCALAHLHRQSRSPRPPFSLDLVLIEPSRRPCRRRRRRSWQMLEEESHAHQPQLGGPARGIGTADA